MKSLCSLLFYILFFMQSALSQDDPQKAAATARAYMQKGDYQNAAVVLTLALQNNPYDLDYSKELALCHLYLQNYDAALSLIKHLIDNESADEQCYLIYSDIHRHLDRPKECEKIFKKGIRRFPNSGPLYNELGELYKGVRNDEALEAWEKGIEKDPSYSRNYYNAAKYHLLTGEIFWGIIYAEIFVNMEPTSTKTPEIKKMLLEGWKKIFDQGIMQTNILSQTNFKSQCLRIINAQSETVKEGINTESLLMLRTRFILNWTSALEKRFPFKLFEWHRQLLREGLFDSYNRWLFGPVEDLPAFQQWVQKNRVDYQLFIDLQQSRVFKIPEKQNYH
jgi:tetratricopeptide (TPR) repeat protein